MIILQWPNWPFEERLPAQGKEILRGSCRPVPVISASISDRLLGDGSRHLQLKKQIIGNAP